MKDIRLQNSTRRRIIKNKDTQHIPMYRGIIPTYGLGSWLSKNKWFAAIPGIGTAAVGLNELNKATNHGLEKNAGVIGTVVGAGAGALIGNPMLGASLGGAVGSGIQNNYNQNQQMQTQDQMQQEQLALQKEQLAQQQMQSLAANRVAGLNNQQYTSQFKNGGMIKSYNNGGLMKQALKNNPNITYFKTGGTHESNAIGGIPVGNRGLVEQGEFKVKLKNGDYIFSNRF